MSKKWKHTKSSIHHLPEDINQCVALVIVKWLGTQNGIRLEKQLIESWKQTGID